MANPSRMETTEVAKRVAHDIDDVLATVALVRENPRLTDHLFDQLVDLLLESSLVDLRTRLGEGALTPREYSDELADLAIQCRAVGLLERS